jgi:hypothetical protein
MTPQQLRSEIRAEIDALAERSDLGDEEKRARYFELAEMEVRSLGDGPWLEVADALSRLRSATE